MERNFQPIANIFIILINMTHNTHISPSIRVIVVLYEHTFKLSEDTSEWKKDSLGLKRWKDIQCVGRKMAHRNMGSFAK